MLAADDDVIVDGDTGRQRRVKRRHSRHRPRSGPPLADSFGRTRISFERHIADAVAERQASALPLIT